MVLRRSFPGLSLRVERRRNNPPGVEFHDDPSVEMIRTLVMQRRVHKVEIGGCVGGSQIRGEAVVVLEMIVRCLPLFVHTSTAP
jgi:hypothetical protein